MHDSKWATRWLMAQLARPEVIRDKGYSCQAPTPRSSLYEALCTDRFPSSAPQPCETQHGFWFSDEERGRERGETGPCSPKQVRDTDPSARRTCRHGSFKAMARLSPQQAVGSQTVSAETAHSLTKRDMVVWATRNFAQSPKCPQTTDVFQKTTPRESLGHWASQPQ